MATLSEYFNLCNYCVFAPSLCDNDPENCAAYVCKHGVQQPAEEVENGNKQ